MIVFPFSFPLWFLTQSHNMHLIWKPSTWPPVTAWLETHLFCEWGSYGTYTISFCPSMSLWCFYLLVVSTGCPGLPLLGFFFCSMVWGILPLLQIHRPKVSLLMFKFLLNLDSVSIGGAKRGGFYELYLLLDILV